MLLILLTLFVNTAGAVFIQYSWRITQWDPPLVMTIAEAMKCCISYAIVKHLQLPFDLKGVWKFALPSALYSVLNISVTYAYSVLPAHYIVTVANLKIVWAMCFAQRMLHRTFAYKQWTAAGIIIFGLVIISSKPIEGSIQDMLGAILFGLIASVISAAAGTACEYIYISAPETSIHVQNVKLYAFGTVFNAFVFLLHGKMPTHWHWSVNVIIIYYACAGILVSFVLKHIGNVARNLIGAVTMLCVTLCSHFLLGNEITLQFGIGGVFVCFGTILYNTPAKEKQVDESEQCELIQKESP